MKRHAMAAMGLGVLLPALAVVPALAGPDDADQRLGDENRIGEWQQNIAPGSTTVFSGEVTDLSTATDAPTDGVQATAFIARGLGGSIAGLKLTGFDESAAGTEFGAHVHTGSCEQDDPDGAGPHYNDDVANGREPVQVDRTTEVWFDLEVSDQGTAGDGTVVPFVIPEPQDGAASIVLHEEPTDAEGDAGGRTACIPLD